jgi:hypothetical protein
MSTIEPSPHQFNTCEQARPAFVTAGGLICRRVQGGIKHCLPLDLALMSVAAEVVCWRLEAHRQEG